MRPECKIIFASDRLEENDRYRFHLMNHLCGLGYSPRNIGVFERHKPNAAALLALAGQIERPIVSSHLRTNLVALLLIWVPGMIILNGLGRHRARRALRIALLALLRINPRKVTAVQCYADYRYLRRFGKGVRLDWVPGSGGTVKPVGSGAGFVAVQRDSKVAAVSRSLHDFARGLGPDTPLTITGCADTDALSRLFPRLPVRAGGIAAQGQILCAAPIFVQPDGYGDGFPHSLADAIVSGMEIRISRRAYLRFGLPQLGATAHEVQPGWLRVRPNAGMKARVAADRVSSDYGELLQRHWPAPRPLMVSA